VIVDVNENGCAGGKGRLSMTRENLHAKTENKQESTQYIHTVKCAHAQRHVCAATYDDSDADAAAYGGDEL